MGLVHEFSSESGNFANSADFNHPGGGTDGNLPSLGNNLEWQFNYATGVLSVANALTFSGSATWVSRRQLELEQLRQLGRQQQRPAGRAGHCGPPGGHGHLQRFDAVTPITLDVNPTLAALSFSGSNYIVISGSGSLTMSNSSTGMATVTVTGGTQAIASAIRDFRRKPAVVVSGSGVLGFPATSPTTSLDVLAFIVARR